MFSIAELKLFYIYLTNQMQGIRITLSDSFGHYKVLF